MNWSSVYDASGEETGQWDREEYTSSRTGILQSLQNYSPLVCYFFTVNYILGVGCLGIPFAFKRSGLELATFLIVAISFVSYITVMWVAETSHHGMQIRIDLLRKNPFRSPRVRSRMR